MMESEWRLAALAVGTFLFVFVMLLACVRSCAKVSEMSVLSAMEPAERARYLAAGQAARDRRQAMDDDDDGQQPRRYIRWISPFATSSPAIDARGDGVFVVSSGNFAHPTTANYDVTTTRSIIAANYDSQLPSYEEATGGLPAYHLANEEKSDQKKSTTTTTTTTTTPIERPPPEYCETLKPSQRY